MVLGSGDSLAPRAGSLIREAPQRGVWGLLPGSSRHPSLPLWALLGDSWILAWDVTVFPSKSLEKLLTHAPRCPRPSAAACPHWVPSQAQAPVSPSGPSRPLGVGRDAGLSTGHQERRGCGSPTKGGERSGARALRFSILPVSPCPAFPSRPRRPHPRPCTWPAYWGSTLTCRFWLPGPLRGQEPRPGAGPCSEAPAY